MSDDIATHAAAAAATGDSKYLRSFPGKYVAIEIGYLQFKHVPALFQGQMGRGSHSACQHEHFMVKAVQLIKTNRLVGVHII